MSLPIDATITSSSGRILDRRSVRRWRVAVTSSSAVPRRLGRSSSSGPSAGAARRRRVARRTNQAKSVRAATPPAPTMRSIGPSGEGRRLVQDLLGDGDLAKVMEQRRDPDPFDLLVREAHLDADAGRQRRDHVGWTAAVVRLWRQDRCERLRRGVAGPLTDRGRLRAAFGRDRRPSYRAPSSRSRNW